MIMNVVPVHGFQEHGLFFDFPQFLVKPVPISETRSKNVCHPNPQPVSLAEKW